MTRRNTVEDVWARVAVAGDGECWLWLGSCTLNGYGQFYLAGHKTTAHRAAYLSRVGPVPDGLQLDHLCGMRRCCNPKHLEAVTAAENTKRARAHDNARTHCVVGHAYGQGNDGRTSNGWRFCLSCALDPTNSGALRASVAVA